VGLRGGLLQPIILQARAFFGLDLTPLPNLALDQLSVRTPTFNWIDDALVNAIAAWQQGHNLPVDGALTAATRASMAEGDQGFLKPGWYGKLDDQDTAQFQTVASAVGPDSQARRSGKKSPQQAIVAAAKSQVGTVHTANRGDGKKFGWKRLVEYYKAAGIYRDSYLAKLQQPGNDTGEKGGPWSWCGIFAIWAVKTATGRGAWVNGRPDLEQFTHVEGRTGIETDDVVAIQGNLNHHTVVASLSSDGKIVRTIDGNQWYQGVYPNHRDTSTVASFYRVKLL
jgi:hypothetical protein